jgi:CDP-4-dehydro-6-deoxyglucose reductase, E1
MTIEYDYPMSFKAWGQEEREAIDRVRASDWWTQGPEVEALENEFAAYHGLKHGIAVNSGSSANEIAVLATFHVEHCAVQRGDLAVVPALSWGTLYSPLVRNGLGLIVKDCDQTWNAPQVDCERPVRILMTCSVLGNPAPYTTYQKAIAHTKDIFWIDDCCESVGAWIGPLGEKRMVGSFAKLNTFSFFYSHQIAGVEGGMICTDDDELAAICRSLRDHGLTRWKGKSDNFEGEYRFIYFGLNVRMTEMYAAIARAQLAKLETMCRHRQQNFNNFEMLCTGLPIQIPPRLRNGVRSPFGLNFTVESKDVRSRLVAALRENSIDCRLPTGGSFRLHPYAERWKDQQTPNADRIHDTGIFLGNAPFPIADKIERAVKIMRETL